MQLPEAFKEKYTRLLGADAAAFLASFDAAPVSGFRRDPVKPWPLDEATDDPVPWSPWGYYGKIAGNDIDHVAGLVYSQEPSAQFVGTVAAPQAGERVLDLCAAPGGKSTQLASYLGDTGLLVSNEINPARSKVLSGNLERWGSQNILVTNNDPDTLAKAWPQTFDRILVDAPCSGEGMFRKDPDAVQYWHRDYPAECAARQKQILQAAVKMLQPSGELIYSTCTFSPEEDEQIIAWLLTNYDMTLEPIKTYPGMEAGRPEWADGNQELAKAVRLFPHRLRGEGHFVAKLRLAGEKTVHTPAAASVKPLAKPAMDEVRDFFATSLNQPLTGQFYRHGDFLSLLPATMLPFDRVKVVRAGLELGSFRKKRFEPSHSLATALSPNTFQTVIEVDQDGYARYRHGETLPTIATGKRFVLLTFEHKPFAIGKLVNGTIKNFYPKGLRV
ncbi:RsmF rRNA methyltransferase first C-terminal domain-containing protein [Lacticaseibacillus casei]|uniref:RsmF rRNA methyltransferase first C-terminal domain-containing protein n=1 Tax=Lacticaseibacillus huelsenbergensis TaxID=3035291 RepID=A0ABY8DPT3_9LACO|nr:MULTISPECIES: RsmF rRNA methyltransferase first C-terminal domain-containing protein [Lacticaseibacillus]MDG3060742.1 RsmF rRNA methyltransferase first C-terminal domain-containing protein [Lacticaseibacillus sp. BCRC 81376]QXG59540.1 RsmF rRNA methyltransferase first C-terminal domain-containing protein [Lacticaseibacillus casei]WFB38999.1 RsmF rRNA methyltransferase first C-terminal domain-containing protein [Lacticaseibacillus huelsenbergensis]WFB40701.1 RsmF rRNA methyltransferase first 